MELANIPPPRHQPGRLDPRGRARPHLHLRRHLPLTVAASAAGELPVMRPASGFTFRGDPLALLLRLRCTSGHGRCSPGGDPTGAESESHRSLGRGEGLQNLDQARVLEAGLEAGGDGGLPADQVVQAQPVAERCVEQPPRLVDLAAPDPGESPVDDTGLRPQLVQDIRVLGATMAVPSRNSTGRSRTPAPPGARILKTGPSSRWKGCLHRCPAYETDGCAARRSRSAAGGSTATAPGWTPVAVDTKGVDQLPDCTGSSLMLKWRRIGDWPTMR
jgi:hypothetical protein